MRQRHGTHGSRTGTIFKTIASFCAVRPWSVFGVCLAVTIGFLAVIHLREMKVDNSPEAFVSKQSSPYRILQQRRADFGSDYFFIVVVTGEVYTEPFLHRLASLQAAIADLGQPRAPENGSRRIEDITSILTVFRSEMGAAATIATPWPDSPAALAGFRRRVEGNPDCRGLLVDEGGRHAAIMVRAGQLPIEDLSRLYRQIHQAAKEFDAPGFMPMVTGPPAISARLNELTIQDSQRAFLLATVLVLTALGLLFRHPVGILAPVLVLVLALIWTLGCLAALGIQPTLMMAILPGFLMAVAVGDAIHLQSIYRDLRGQGLENLEAIVAAADKSGTPIVYTSLTTMAGLLSFHGARISAIADLGLAGAIGIFFALLLTATLMPAALSLNRKGALGATGTGDDWIWQLVNRCSRLSRGPTRRWLVLMVGTLVLAVSIIAASRVRLFHDPLVWVPAEEEIRQATRLYDQWMGGAADVSIVVAPKGGRNLLDARVLAALTAFEKHVLAYRDPHSGEPVVGSAFSVLNLLRQGGAVAPGIGWPHLPTGPDSGPLLFSMAQWAQTPSLRHWVSEDFSRGVMMFRIRWLPATSYASLNRYVRAGIEEHLASLAEVEATGSAFMLLSTIGDMVSDLARSLAIALAVVTVLIVVMLKSWRLGLVAMLPNLAPIVMVLGLMGVWDLPFDLNNLLFASIALGICVDDTIHFLHHFSGEYRRSGDTEAAIARALGQSGRAMVATSVVLLAATCIYCTATLHNFRSFGYLLGATIGLALFADLVLGPAALRTLLRDRRTLPE